MVLDLVNKGDKKDLFLLFSVFATAFCGLIYQLLIGTISSYFQGDSVKQFSITIGFFMSGMGLGSYLSRLVKKDLLLVYVNIEILLGFVGGLSVPLLYLAFAYTSIFSLVMILFNLLIGLFIGFEIPLLTRELAHSQKLRLNLSNVLSLDYLGALIATLCFPFILLPILGTYKTSLVFGIINLFLGLITYFLFRNKVNLKKDKVLYLFTFFFTSVLILALYYSSNLIQFWNNKVYADPVIYSHRSDYQDIVLTSKKNRVNLYLNGNLQFSSADEYRYHEPLVLVPAEACPVKTKILVLGGGDGLVVRELLKYDEIKFITLVDLDPAVTELAKTNRFLKKFNQNSLNNSKVAIVNQDAFLYLKDSQEKYDFIIADLPDPNNLSLAKLYSLQFYRFIMKNLTKDGLFVTQATNAIRAKKAFWSILKTVKAAGFGKVYPFSTYIPSFGQWGFVVASKIRNIDFSNVKLSVPTKFLTNDIITGLFIFSKDALYDLSKLRISTLDDPIISSYYLSDWEYWN